MLLLLDVHGGVFDGAADVAFGAGEAADGFGLVHIGFEHDQSDGDAATCGLDDIDGFFPSDFAGAHQDANSTLDELGVVHVHVHHQVFVHIAQAGHGTGGDHVGDHLLGGGGLHAGGTGDDFGPDFGDDGGFDGSGERGARIAGDAGRFCAEGARVRDSGDDVGGASAGGEADDDVFAAGTAAGDIALAQLFRIFVDFDGRCEGFGSTSHDVLHGLGAGGEVGGNFAGVESGEASAGAGADVDEAAAFAESMRHAVDDLGDLRDGFLHRGCDFLIFLINDAGDFHR